MKLDYSNIPTLHISKEELENGVTIVDVLVAIGHADSRSEARRLVNQGAVKISKPRIINQKAHNYGASTKSVE